jgi:MerR family transcriptional regulator, redox-sensitive transcriptional activator SoxR
LTAPPAELLPIGEVSRRTGLAVSAIRYYEERGLVHPVARAGGQRRFDEAAVRRLHVISSVQKAGFSLDEIGELLQEGPSGNATRRALVLAKLSEVRLDIQRLQTIAAALEEALDCGCNSLEHCPILVPAESER